MATLKDLRQGAGLTQKELATQAGVSVSTVQWIEQGGYRGTCPTYRTLRKLAAALGVSVGMIEVPEAKVDAR